MMFFAFVWPFNPDVSFLVVFVVLVPLHCHHARTNKMMTLFLATRRHEPGTVARRGVKPASPHAHVEWSDDLELASRHAENWRRGRRYLLQVQRCILLYATITTFFANLAFRMTKSGNSGGGTVVLLTTYAIGDAVLFVVLKAVDARCGFTVGLWMDFRLFFLQAALWPAVRAEHPCPRGFGHALPKWFAGGLLGCGSYSRELSAACQEEAATELRAAVTSLSREVDVQWEDALREAFERIEGRACCAPSRRVQPDAVPLPRTV